MSEKKWQTGLNVIAFVGLATALPIVIHSLVTGEGIHTGGLLLMIYFVLHLLQQWKGRTWRALPVIAFGGAAVGFALLIRSMTTGQGVDGIALGGGIIFALLGLNSVLSMRSGAEQ